MFVCSLGCQLHLPDSAAEARRVLLWPKGKLPMRDLRMPWFLWLHEGQVSQLSAQSIMSCTTRQGSVQQKETTANDMPLAVGAATSEPRWRRWMGGRLDRAGIVWSVLCAFHCGLPLALSSAALLSGVGYEHGHGHAHQTHEGGSGAQLVLTLATTAFAGLLLGRSYLRGHRDWRPLGLFAVAVIAFGTGAVVQWQSAATAMSFTVLGFVGLVAAQLVNATLVRRSSQLRGARSCC